MTTNDQELPRRIGQYEILGALGKGAMGAVYKGMQPSLNRVVAIKVLPKEFAEDDSRVERFEREAQAVAKINHANVVQIIEKDRDGDTLYFVMEYVKGTSLDALLQQRRLTLHEAFTVFKGICRGLDAAHRQNIVHRDLNPRNVLLSEDLSTVKLADFGISRVEDISRLQGTLSTKEHSMGTLHYMAPEQAIDMAQTDHRADIYSAGVVFYEMLTGRVPVGRFSLPSQINSEVPSLVDPIVLKCLASEPQDRYPTVSKLLETVRKTEEELRLSLASELRGISHSTSRILRKSTSTLMTPGRRKKVYLGGAGVLLLAIVAVLFLTLRGDSGAEGEPVLVAETEPFEAPQSAEELLEEALDEVSAPTPAPPPKTAPRPAATQRPAPSQPVKAGPTSAEAEDLEVARNKVEAGLFDPAVADIARFLETHAQSSLVPEAYLLLAEAHSKAGRRQDALAAYVEIESRFSDATQAIEALFRRATLTAATDAAQARSLFSQVAARAPDSPFAVLSLGSRADLEIKGKLEQTDPELGVRAPAALSTYRELVALAPEHPAAEKAYWNLGEMHRELKQFDLAAGYYASLGERFPATRYDAWWEAGQLYERRLDDEEKAREAYSRVPASSQRSDNAVRRLKKLGG